MLLPVFPRGGADIGLEYPGKVADGGKPEIRPDGGEGLIGIAEEALGFLGLSFRTKSVRVSPVSSLNRRER